MTAKNHHEALLDALAQPYTAAEKPEIAATSIGWKGSITPGGQTPIAARGMIRSRIANSFLFCNWRRKTILIIIVAALVLPHMGVLTH